MAGELFFSAFMTLFVVIDPPGCAPIYAALTKGTPGRQVVSIAMRACLIAAAILLVFALFRGGRAKLDNGLSGFSA